MRIFAASRGDVYVAGFVMEHIDIDLGLQDAIESTALLPPSSSTSATGVVVNTDVGTAENDVLLGVPSAHGQVVPYSLVPARRDALYAQSLLGARELLVLLAMHERSETRRAHATERAPASRPRRDPNRAVSAARLSCAGRGRVAR